MEAVGAVDVAGAGAVDRDVLAGCCVLLVVGFRGACTRTFVFEGWVGAGVTVAVEAVSAATAPAAAIEPTLKAAVIARTRRAARSRVRACERQLCQVMSELSPDGLLLTRRRRFLCHF